MHSVTEASEFFLERGGPHCRLVEQSIHTHFRRLVPLQSMACFEALSGSILDVGAGTGALALDLAWRGGGKVFVTALDNDREALKIAQGISDHVGVGISALGGNAYALPVKDASQDVTVARYLFQHLREPAAALLQMRRVTRPGGRIVIIDVDDEVVLCDPAEQHMVNLRKALGVLQAKRGGNRSIGRQLYRLMRQAGLEAIQVIVIPFVRMGLQNGRSCELEAFKVERVLEERKELLDSAIMSAQDFDLAVSELKQGFAQDRFEMDADFVATGLAPQ
ncbi:MAG: class I SAM-dependent methyltransferase [Syntrophobacteraceae bacterium]